MSEKMQQLSASLYKDRNGQPMHLTEHQAIIFELIFKRLHPRNWLSAYTQYGKSLTVALAVLTRVATFPEKWAVVAPSEKKARIIMGYIIDHSFDNEYTKLKLEIEKGESVERLRRERSKSRLTFKHSDGGVGEIYILSADSRNKQNAGDSLMGFGAPNVVLDEAALIDDDIEIKIFRMLGGTQDNFYLKIGNPFKRNHFLKDYRDPNFFKLSVDYKIGIEEGRLNQEFVEEAKKKPFFDVLYENRFPEASAIDDKGWSNLITDKEYENALVAKEDVAEFGTKNIGHDVARGGGNFNVWVLKSDNFATVLAKNSDNDLMSTVGTTIRLAVENKVNWQNVSLDDTGLGGGCTDRLKEQGFKVNAVKLGGQAKEQTKFINRRAENYWKVKKWINNGGKLDKDCDWSELLDIKYKTDSSGRLQIMSKDEMRRNGIESPDVADALMMSFDSSYVKLFDRADAPKKKKAKNIYATRMV